MEKNALSNLVITRVRSVSTMFTPENTRQTKHGRSCWGLILKHEGETVYTANGKKYLSDAIHPILLPKGCSYEWQCTRAGHFTVIDFECDTTYSEPLTFTLKSGERILRTMKELEYKRNLKKPTVELESIRDTYSILLSLIGAEPERYLHTEKQEKIALATEYISKNYTSRITNEELAARVGLSTVYFRKLFTSITGVSPIAYAHALRIEKAKEMLKSDCGTLSDVAQSLGYSSLYDFSRDFKRHTGIAPSKY